AVLHLHFPAGKDDGPQLLLQVCLDHRVQLQRGGGLAAEVEMAAAAEKHPALQLAEIIISLVEMVNPPERQSLYRLGDQHLPAARRNVEPGNEGGRKSVGADADV